MTQRKVLNRNRKLPTQQRETSGAGTMNLGSNRYRASLIREDAYFSEVDQILLANLRETLELQEEASRAAGNCGEQESSDCSCSERQQLSINSFVASH